MTSPFTETILAALSKTRYATAEVADALGKTGAIPGVRSLHEASYATGITRCLFTANMSNYYLHQTLDEILPGELVIVFTEGCGNRAIMGAIVCSYIFESRKASGLIVQGSVRDVDEIVSKGYPVWANGANPIGCFNKDTLPYDEQKAMQIREQFDGGIAVCDATGAIVIEKKYHTAETLKRLVQIKAQERIWKYCTETLGWNTFDTICQKRYLKDSHLFPKDLQADIAQLHVNLEKNDQKRG